MEHLEDIKWSHIRRVHHLTGELIDPDRITVLVSQEVNSGKFGFGILVDKKLSYTIYP